MNNERVLSILILCDFGVGVAALVSERILEPFLPVPLRAYLAAESTAVSRLTDVLLTALWVGVLAGTVLAWVGLLNLVRAARPLYVASWIGYLALIALSGPHVGSAVGTVVDQLTGLVGGMIVAMIYFSDLRTRFRTLSRTAEQLLEGAA